MEKRYYVETYYVRHRHVGYRVFDSTPPGSAKRRLTGQFVFRDYSNPGKALSGANQLRDDLNDGNQSSGWR